jgi:hypothetical protein
MNKMWCLAQINACILKGAHFFHTTNEIFSDKTITHTGTFNGMVYLVFRMDYNFEISLSKIGRHFQTSKALHRLEILLHIFNFKMFSKRVILVKI